MATVSDVGEHDVRAARLLSSSEIAMIQMHGHNLHTIMSTIGFAI